MDVLGDVLDVIRGYSPLGNFDPEWKIQIELSCKCVREHWETEGGYVEVCVEIRGITGGGSYVGCSYKSLLEAWELDRETEMRLAMDELFARVLGLSGQKNAHCVECGKRK